MDKEVVDAQKLWITFFVCSFNAFSPVSFFQRRQAMADCLVDCINKQDRSSTHEGITHLGGPGGTQRWRWPRAGVIDSIESGTNTFYTKVDGKRADIAVVNGPTGKYLRTHADGKWNDNLLALPECI